MFERDRWQEIFSALSQNKVRTLLTSFGVFWGIFMLVIMLGASNGLKNGVLNMFGDFATNSVFIWPQNTTQPYKGFTKGRRWNFTNDDTKALMDQIKEIEYIAPRVNYNTGNPTFIKGKNMRAYRVNGDYPVYNKIDPVTILAGRFINDIDLKNARKVVVIGKNIKEELFNANENPIGQYIQIQGVYFQVIGVFKSKHGGGWGNSINQSAYMPFSTVQKVCNLGTMVFYYGIVAKPQYEVSLLEEKIRKLLANRHKVSPNDKEAFGSQNLEVEYKKMTNLFTGINLVTWIVGTLTLIAGVIGISNIMLIIVKERTKEIGIQRAIGATPSKIISQIIQESIFLTFISGMIGMMLGVMIIEGVNSLLKNAPAASDGMTMFMNPEVNLQTAITALIFLVISGTFAGMIPARKAIKIKPIDALRTEI